MGRFLFLLFLWIGLAGYCSAQLPLDQEKFVDSLNNILKQNGTDSVKARANFFLLYYWTPRDTQKARQYLDAGRALSRKYPYLEALSYAHEGYFYYTTDMDKSEAAFKKADALLTRFRTKEAYIARTNIWSNCAVLQQRVGNDNAYVDIVLNKVIPLALLAKDTALVASQYSGLGVSFMNTDQYEKAETYFDKAIAILENSHTQPSRLVATYNRAGENYINLHKYKEAEIILVKVKNLLEPYPESELYAGFYLVQGLYNHHLGLYAKAVTNFDKGVIYANGPNKPFIIRELLFLKARSLIAGKYFESALLVLQKLSGNEDLMIDNTSRQELYELLAESYAGTGNMYMAYNYQKRYSDLSDSLTKSRLQKDINELEIKYQKAQSQKEIVVLKAKNEQTALSARNSKLLSWLLGSATLFLLIIATFALLYYRNNKKLLVQKELNHKQQLKEIEQQQRLQFGQAVLQGEEQERRRLARDLHDGLGGMLAGVKINLTGQVVDNTSLDQRSEWQRIITQLDNSVTELRRIAHNMMPVNLLQFGLETALRDLCESYMTDTIHIDFQAYSIEEHMAEQIQINIYRIVQETLANAIKHAEATHIMLQCSQDGNTFLITQEDNGKGFDTSIAGAKKGIGLSNIRNRVGFLSGKMEIESEFNEGTTINIELYVG